MQDFRAPTSDDLFGGLRHRLTADDAAIAATWARQELEWGKGNGVARTARVWAITQQEVLDALHRAAGEGPLGA